MLYSLYSFVNKKTFIILSQGVLLLVALTELINIQR